MIGAFEPWVATVFRVEGVESDDAHDPGNAGGHVTRYGLTQPFYDEYRRRKGLPPRDTREATREEAVEAYRLLIWEDPHIAGARVSSIAPQTGFIYCDAAVNQGPWVVGNLQQYVRARVDGWFGPRSQTQLQIVVANTSDAFVAMHLCERRRARYEGTRGYDRYGRGWRNRLNTVAEAAGLPWRWPEP
jgi:lysozyme family protein